MMNTIRALVIGGGEAIPMRKSAKTGALEQLRVTRTLTLAEGLDALRESPFQLVFLDLSLPDASASESITKILTLAKDLPVIAFVSDGETAKALEAMRCGEQDFVLKGGQCDSLIRTIQYAIERKQLIVDREIERQQITKDNGQLVASLSHEFRNALTCIFQFGNILIGGLTGELSEEQRQYLRIMLENASRIRNVVDSLTEGALARLGECGDNNEPLSRKAN